MAIGPDFRSIAVQALLGPDRSGLIPSTLYVGWLDADGELIAMSGTTVSHAAFGPTENGVHNVVALDCGVAGEGWVIAAIGLYTDAEGESLLITADLPEPVEPDEGSPRYFDVGGLTFTVDSDLDEGGSE